MNKNSQMFKNKNKIINEKNLKFIIIFSYSYYKFIMYKWIIIENARKKFEEQMKPENIALYLYSILKNLKGVGI